MGHGGGGRLSAELIEHLFLPAFRANSGAIADLGDAAVVAAGGARLAFSTDSFVVRPRFFPGGNLGDLAANGTINDVPTNQRALLDGTNSAATATTPAKP